MRDEEGNERSAKPTSIIFGPYTQDGTSTLNRILGDGKAFTFPKPEALIEHFLLCGTSPGNDDLILDFFAGSGTTAHAVHKLNQQDGGNRRVILVSSTEATAENPDKNLCRDVCAKRVRRVIEGYGDTPGTGSDFAYLRCRRIPVGEMLEIDHEQVWLALQMIHLEAFSPYQDENYLWAGDDNQALVYIPRLRAEFIKSLTKRLRDVLSAVVYSWQPEAVSQHIKFTHVQHEAIPESLARRFGVKL